MTELKEPLQEFVCLGMLACLTTSFKIPGRRITYRYLADRFRQSCFAMLARPEQRELEVLELWGLMMGAISVFDIEEEVWLLARGAEVAKDQGVEWQDVQKRLQSIMWIGCIHDEAGNKMFEKMKSAVTQ
jgi:hypothetical protein